MKPRALPRCARAGCPNRVKRKGCAWCSPECIPLEARQAWGRKGRGTAAYRLRRQKFAEELARIRAAGRTVTSEDLVATFQRIYRRAYNAGFNAAKHHRTPAIVEAA